jgi:hypothetical protein
MQKNHIYNLMEQYVQEHKALWRIKGDYAKDAKGKGDELAYWKKLASEKETNLKTLGSLIKKHLA